MPENILKRHQFAKGFHDLMYFSSFHFPFHLTFSPQTTFEGGKDEGRMIIYSSKFIIFHLKTSKQDFSQFLNEYIRS